MYSIKAVTALTGLGAETLRAWERRYQAIIPRRDDNGRRSYSQLDLERLTLLANLTRQGHAISKVSDLQLEQLQQLIVPVDENTQARQEFIGQIVEALSAYRIDRCEQLLKRALMANEPLAYLRDILSPALNYVGQLWHDDKISIAQEHLFSACVKRILLGMVNSMHSYSDDRPGILFATPSGEPHEFGILMCCLLAAEQQFNCFYLGANVPAADLLDAAAKLKTEIMVLSLVKSPADKETAAALLSIASKVNEDKVSIWLGGGGARLWLAEQEEPPENCEYIGDLDGFYAKARLRRYE